MTEMEIHIERETLGDGSEVFNVRFGSALFHAIDEIAAWALAEEMAEAIKKHTVDDSATVHCP
jgi:hypothetical protein